MKKISFAIVGWTVLLVGIVLIPYPGPGWAIVFTGLFILSRQYHWARRTLEFTKERYDSYMDWIDKQPFYIRSITFIATGVVVVATLWLLNTYGLVASWFGIDWDWLRSPLFS